MKTRNAKNAIGLSTLVVLSLSAAAHATIVTTTGSVTQIAPPPSCAPGALIGFTAFTWNEQQNVPLNLIVDMVNNPGSSNAPTPGAINGTYSSHFLHFEQIPGVPPATGTITYAQPIVAVIFRNINLDNSDGPAGAFGTIYPTSFPMRGLITAPVSFVTINANVLTFDLSSVFTFANVNQIRVITQAPAPGSAALLGLGGLVCFRRRR